MRRYTKYLVALLGVPGQLVALGLVHGTALHWTQLAVALLTAEGVRMSPPNDVA